MFSCRNCLGTLSLICGTRLLPTKRQEVRSFARLDELQMICEIFVDSYPLTISFPAWLLSSMLMIIRPLNASQKFWVIKLIWEVGTLLIELSSEGMTTSELFLGICGYQTIWIEWLTCFMLLLVAKAWKANMLLLQAIEWMAIYKLPHKWECQMKSWADKIRR